MVANIYEAIEHLSGTSHLLSKYLFTLRLKKVILFAF